MSDRENSDSDDLAYLKRLALAGRGAPAPFLLLMAVFGGAYGLWAVLTCLAVLFAFATGDEGPAFGDRLMAISSWGFVVANLVFIAGVGWTLWRTLGPRREAVSRSAAAIWSSAFFGLLTVLGATFASARTTSHVVFDAGALSAILLILWGCAWWATAIASDRRWLLAVAGGSFVAAVVLTALGQSFWGFPILAACLILFAFLPAVLLMREGRR